MNYAQDVENGCALVRTMITNTMSAGLVGVR